MEIKIALAGNPNCGKTTLFNALTGSNQFVGNWPGVTVEKKEGKLKNHKDIIVTDLPGIYSLSPYTLEEVVARNYLIEERPNAILNIIDGTNLERNLYLTTQLVELGIPVVVAINMMDIVQKNGDKINLKQLSKELGCKVVEISALKGTGIDEAINTVVEVAKSNERMIPQHSFCGCVEHAIAHIEEAFLHDIPEERQRWYAIKIFERDAKIVEKLKISDSVKAHIEKDIQSAETEMDDDAESIITNERYIYIGSIINDCYYKANKCGMSTSDKIETNRILALPIFAVIMFIVYYISVTTVGTLLTDATNGFFEETVAPAAQSALESINCADWLTGLIVDGIIGGVGAVLGFVPQMLVLFIFLGFLESCGYMARIAFVMDRIFRRFGLSGKSFIPMLIATGCGVPGVMASRTIEIERDRRMTVMLKKTKMFSGDPAPFVMELPAYHMPTVGNVLRSMWERGWSFIKKAGTVILISSIVLWFLQGFGIEDGSFGMVDDLNNSVLAKLGNIIAPIFAPLGFGDWKSAVAVVTGLIAKENVVATFGILYGGLDEVSEDGAEVWTALQTSMTALAGYSFLVFNLLCAPCFAAMGAIKREMNNGKWTAFAIGYQCVFAYAVSLMVYQFGSLFTGNGNIIGVIFAVVILAFILFMLFKPYKESTTLSNDIKVKV